jgi:hypothetical protein
MDPMKPLLTAFLLLTSLALTAQRNIIKGRVVQAAGGEPVPNASIFVNSSTRGTTSKADGSFELTDVPAGNHDIVVSCIGYVTVLHAYSAKDLPLTLEVRMKPKASELATVFVEPDEKDGWNRWGKFFLDNFIGTTAYSEDCRLKNPEVLRFRYSKKTNRLTVLADAPLIIENRALGYNIQYQLEEFSFDYNKSLLLFMGYTLFEDIPTEREGQKKRWAENRTRSFRGSVQHFMRSLYRNDLAVEGFLVRRMTKLPNVEKKRIRGMIQASIQKQRQVGQTPVIDYGDSTAYYNQVLRQPDEHDIIQPHLLTADSLVSGLSETEKNLFFTNYLVITYTKEKEEAGFLHQNPTWRATGTQRSTVSLPNLTPIVIDAKGNYAPLLEFITYGYWAWSEKISNMLPLDYEEEGDKPGTIREKINLRAPDGK